MKDLTFWLLVVTMVLIVVVAVGQWQIYPRLEQIEETLESIRQGK